MLSRRPWSMLDQARRRGGQASQLSCPRLTDGKEGCFGTGFVTRCPSHQLPPCQRSVHPALAQLESGHMDYMCQVSSSELGLIDPCLDLCVDFVECALERGVDGAEVWKCGGQARAKETVVEAREEQGCPEAEFGDAIAEAVGQAFDQAVQAQAAQLISDGALRDRVRIAARQSRKMMAQVGCAKAFCELPEQDDGVPQRVDARIGKTQARS